MEGGKEKGKGKGWTGGRARRWHRRGKLSARCIEARGPLPRRPPPLYTPTCSRSRRLSKYVFGLSPAFSLYIIALSIKRLAAGRDLCPQAHRGWEQAQGRHRGARATASSIQQDHIDIVQQDLLFFQCQGLYQDLHRNLYRSIALRSRCNTTT